MNEPIYFKVNTTIEGEVLKKLREGIRANPQFQQNMKDVALQLQNGEKLGRVEGEDFLRSLDQN